MVKVTDRLGNSDFFAYDANGRITSVIDKNGNVTKYKYDKNGNITQTTDALGNTSAFEYDKLNRLVKATLSGGQEDQVTLGAPEHVFEGIDSLIKEAIKVPTKPNK